LGCDKVREHRPLRATAGCGHQECGHFSFCFVWRVGRVDCEEEREALFKKVREK
jgi:hypothetical protein